MALVREGNGTDAHSIERGLGPRDHTGDVGIFPVARSKRGRLLPFSLLPACLFLFLPDLLGSLTSALGKGRFAWSGYWLLLDYQLPLRPPRSPAWPPLERASCGFASLTISVRPSIWVPFNAAIAARAS